MASNHKPSADSSAATNSHDTRSQGQITSKNSNVSNSTTDGGRLAAIKKIPPIKAPVSLAKPPDLKNCKSKVGSLHNIKHAPTSSGITIQSQKLKWEAKSKVGSLENKAHRPGGGGRKIETQKLEWKTTSKVQSLDNIKHKPGGGNVKIFNESYLNKTPNEDEKQIISSNESTESGPIVSKPTAEKNIPTDGLEKDLKDLRL